MLSIVIKTNYPEEFTVVNVNALMYLLNEEIRTYSCNKHVVK